ncbi:MAG: thioredoxin [Rickettsiales bacterium]|nr:thioredoxin [Rickettsiales bacterium]
MVLEVKDDNFAVEVLQSDIPVLVDFWASWCAPCKQLNPVINELAEKYATRLKIVKVNIEDSPEVPTKYEVRGIPNLILFKDGKVIDSKVGALPVSALSQWLDNYLA